MVLNYLPRMRPRWLSSTKYVDERLVEQILAIVLSNLIYVRYPIDELLYYGFEIPILVNNKVRKADVLLKLPFNRYVIYEFTDKVKETVNKWENLMDEKVSVLVVRPRLSYSAEPRINLHIDEIDKVTEHLHVLEVTLSIGNLGGFHEHKLYSF